MFPTIHELLPWSPATPRERNKIGRAQLRMSLFSAGKPYRRRVFTTRGQHMTSVNT